LPRSGRPAKLSNNKVAGLTRIIDNKTGVSQPRLAKQYNVSPSAISRTISKRRNIRIYKHKKAPKYSEEQQKRAQKETVDNCIVEFQAIVSSSQMTKNIFL
jgi:IS30 family transposase